jgi:hypothetical protein
MVFSSILQNNRLKPKIFWKKGEQILAVYFLGVFSSFFQKKGFGLLFYKIELNTMQKNISKR